MASLVDSYRRQVRHVLDGIATWLPGDKVSVGDFGLFVGNRFRREGTIKDFGAELSIRAGNPQPWRYAATKTTSIEVGASSGAMAGPEATFNVAFSKSGSYLFHAHNARRLETTNEREMRDNVVDAHMRGEWDFDWFVIDSVYEAERATILIAQDDDASLQLNVSGDLGLPQLPLAHPGVNVGVTLTSGEVLQFLNIKDATPLFTCRQLRKKFFGGEKFEPVRDGSALKWKSVQLEELEETG